MRWFLIAGRFAISGEARPLRVRRQQFRLPRGDGAAAH